MKIHISTLKVRPQISIIFIKAKNQFDFTDQLTKNSFHFRSVESANKTNTYIGGGVFLFNFI